MLVPPSQASNLFLMVSAEQGGGGGGDALGHFCTGSVGVSGFVSSTLPPAATYASIHSLRRATSSGPIVSCLRQSLNRPIQSLKVPIFATFPGISYALLTRQRSSTNERAQTPVLDTRLFSLENRRA